MQIRVGTRRSKLALTQTNAVIALLQKTVPNAEFEIVEITTSGDILYEQNLALIGGKGLFLKEIEEQLLEHKIDIAVHSMKDVPAILPDGLIIGAILEREDVRDVLISQKYSSLSELPQNAVVGTSSSRRKTQLLALRPDLQVINFRGNVTTRIEKIETGVADASILALAGLNRLNMQKQAKEIFSIEQFLPAIGQGAVGIECRSTDLNIIEIIKQVNHHDSNLCVTTERAFMQELEGNCTTPIAGHASIDGAYIKFHGMYANLVSCMYSSARAPIHSALEAAKEAADAIKSQL